MKGKSVLVTGGMGFIGIHLVARLLSDGYKVIVLQKPELRNVPDTWEGQVEVVWDDVRYLERYGEMLRNVAAIYHLAGVSGVRRSYTYPQESLSANNEATIGLLEACRNYNPQVHIIYPSTRLVYGEVKSIPVNEQSEVRPNSIYALHKLTCEHYFELYSTMYGIKSTILRIANPYGPALWTNSQYGIINWFISEALNDRCITVYGDGQQVRDYIFIDDLVDLLCLVVDKGSTGIYNVGSGQGTSLVDAVRLIIDTVGRGSYIHRAWDAVDRLLETGDYITDVQKAKKDIGWAPFVPFRTGLERSIAFMQTRREGDKIR